MGNSSSWVVVPVVPIFEDYSLRSIFKPVCSVGLFIDFVIVLMNLGETLTSIIVRELSLII